MSLTTRAWALVLFALLPALGAGCGGSRPTIPPRGEVELKEIQDIYQLFIKNHQRPPTQMSDLASRQYEGIYPGAVHSLKQGKYVVVWGVKDKDSGTVLAYEKDAPTKGGPVVMADGTVKTMTAEQLQAALKAKT